VGPGRVAVQTALLGVLSSHRGRFDSRNWSGTWPGLVACKSETGSLQQSRRKYSSPWSEGFTDRFFTKKLREWLDEGKLKQRNLACPKFKDAKVPGSSRKGGRKKLRCRFGPEKAILASSMRDCMGMYKQLFRRIAGIKRASTRRDEPVDVVRKGADGVC